MTEEPQKFDRITVTQQRILQKLRTPSTLQELCDAIGLGYHSMRRYVLDLEQRGEVLNSGMRRNKAVVYVRNDHKPPERIPRIKDSISNQEHKAHHLISAVGQEDQMSGTKAVSNVPGHIATLLYYAALIKNGMLMHDQLTELRNALQRDYVVINNSMQVIRQLLESPDWWDPKKLRHMPDDEDYNFYAVKTAYEHVAQREGKEVIL